MASSLLMLLAVHQVEWFPVSVEVREHGFSIANLSYRLNRGEGFLEYQMNLRARDQGSARRLAESLRRLDSVLEFGIHPSGD